MAERGSYGSPSPRPPPLPPWQVCKAAEGDSIFEVASACTLGEFDDAVRVARRDGVTLATCGEARRTRGAPPATGSGEGA